MLALVKPREYLAYENRLGESLYRREFDFVPEAAVGLSLDPEYGTNRDMFEYALASMRRSLPKSTADIRKQLVSEYSNLLRQVMDALKGYLKLLSQSPSEHTPFLVFVRDIISLIRAHASEFCTVDEFFYQISQEYSPPVQDPRLHVAGMVSYGLRLDEGDTRATQQLFYYLYNNFKVALANNRLEEETRMLLQGLENQGIMSFFLGKMLPGIVLAACENGDAFVLLDVYGEALQLYLTNGTAPPEISRDMMPCVAALLKAMAKGIWTMKMNGGQEMAVQDIHVVSRIVTAMNSLWCSLSVLQMHMEPPSCLPDMMATLERLSTFVNKAVECLQQNEDTYISTEIFDGFLSSPEDQTIDRDVLGFSQIIKDDVRRNWVSAGDRISVRAPGKAFTSSIGGVSTSGSAKVIGTIEVEVRDLIERLKAWETDWRILSPNSTGHRDIDFVWTDDDGWDLVL